MDTKFVFNSLPIFVVSAGGVVAGLPMYKYFDLLDKANEQLITQEVYDSLSDIAIRNLNLRQSILERWWLPLIFLLVGVAIIAVGILLWWTKHKNDNKRDTLEIRHMELENMSLEEAMKEKQAKARQDMRSEVGISSEAITDLTNQATLERTTKIISIEDTYCAYLKASLTDGSYSLRQDVKLAGTIYDIVAVSADKQPDRIFEVRNWPNMITPEYFSDTLKALQNASLNYEMAFECSVQTTLLIVANRKHIASWQEMIKGYTLNIAQQHRANFVDSVCIEIITEEDLFSAKNNGLQSWRTNL